MRNRRKRTGSAGSAEKALTPELRRIDNPELLPTETESNAGEDVQHYTDDQTGQADASNDALPTMPPAASAGETAYPNLLEDVYAQKQWLHAQWNMLMSQQHESTLKQMHACNLAGELVNNEILRRAQHDLNMSELANDKARCGEQLALVRLEVENLQGMNVLLHGEIDAHHEALAFIHAESESKDVTIQQLQADIAGHHAETAVQQSALDLQRTAELELSAQVASLQVEVQQCKEAIRVLHSTIDEQATLAEATLSEAKTSDIEAACQRRHVERLKQELSDTSKAHEQTTKRAEKMIGTMTNEVRTVQDTVAVSKAAMSTKLDTLSVFVQDLLLGVRRQEVDREKLFGENYNLRLSLLHIARVVRDKGGKIGWVVSSTGQQGLEYLPPAIEHTHMQETIKSLYVATMHECNRVLSDETVDLVAQFVSMSTAVEMLKNEIAVNVTADRLLMDALLNAGVVVTFSAVAPGIDVHIIEV